MERTITALSLQKRNPRRVNVYLDGEFAFGLSRLVAAWLQVGQKLSEEKVAELLAQEEHEQAYERALRLLRLRPRSVQEIRQRLRRQGIHEGVIQSVIERLTRSGLLDDGAFAQAWVENRNTFRPRSRRALTHELRLHGVESSVIESALQDVDDEAMAYRLAQKKARQLSRATWPEFNAKLHRYLAQRGFDYSLNQQVIVRLWREQREENEKIPGKREDERT